MTAILDVRTNVRRRAARSLNPAGDFADARAGSLAQAVEAAARSVDESMLVPVAGTDAGPAFQPRTLLALLTYCYARQICGSSEVEARLRGDLSLRRLLGDEFPDARVVRRFRCENQAALDFCLRSVLRFLAEEKVAQGFVTRVSEAHLAAEARRRLTTAMFLDSLELDQDAAPDGPVELGYLFAKECALVH
jgi:transposase